AGVVDDHVKPAGLLHRARDSRADVRRIGDVGSEPMNAGMSNTRFLERLLPPRDPEDGRTRLLECHRDRLADSRVGARHENDLAFECLCHAVFYVPARPVAVGASNGRDSCAQVTNRKAGMDLLEKMTTYVRVVEASSFSAAAKQLRISPAAVSRQISTLEDELRVRLLRRTTRKMSITPAG